MLNLKERIKIAYKKLKASVYFDKTQLPLRDSITTYEDNTIDDKLERIAKKLSATEDEWDAYKSRFICSLAAFVFPKTLAPIPQDMVIFNSDCTPIKLEKPQYFIDLDVEGHILSVLWVLSIGMELDKNCEDGYDGMYAHSYGNRLKKNLINNESGDITYSPGLFEPYFSQYENWRDYGLERARERLNDKQDALILTLDFKSFYYSVDLRQKDFDGFLDKLENPELWQKRVNNFVFEVICVYSNNLRKYCAGTELSLGNRNILPIGFLPSNILANWVLTPFDDAIIERWNPVYYGRYVDDVIIVDKVEKNSPLYKRAREKNSERRLTSEEIIRMFLLEQSDTLSISKEVHPALSLVEDISGDPIYRIDPAILASPECDIRVQNSKVKVFYFQSGATQALLNCFQIQIAQNASEFRLMPDLDDVLISKNYSEIFHLKNNESINKFRSVDGVEINKFVLSKFLGKYRKVSGLINGKEENAFEKDLMLILDERALIENYGTWERILEILVVNDRLDLFEKLSLRILNALARYEVPDDKVCTKEIFTKEGLIRVLHSALCRVSALSWGEKTRRVLDHIYKGLTNGCGNIACTTTVIEDFQTSTMAQTRFAYCKTRMINKYVIPLPIDCILSSLSLDNGFSARLYDLSETRQLMDVNWVKKKNDYRYYPYMLTPQEFSFAQLCADINNNITSFNPQQQMNDLEQLFIHRNYPNVQDDDRKAYDLDEVQTIQFSTGSLHFMTRVGKADEISIKNKFCVAIGNAALEVSNFKAALDHKPNRSYKRYRDFSKILDAAIQQNVDLLVLPESYLPMEWLPVVSRACANNQMALVTGIEHIVAPMGKSDGRKRVYNLTATILPYEHQQQKFAYIAYHNKVAYSPEEIVQIEGRGNTYQEGNSYQLFCWHNIWFPVYCCYELASIHDRALFQYYADLIVAVEWNSDINYFSSIVESLCRDLHCYCIQANSSGLGDSRVLCPTKTEQRDIIKTKGGKNPCILAADIDINALREFQNLEYSLQKGDQAFKPTPPKFNRTILEFKRSGTLFQATWKKREYN
ncbi:MAG: hypothetical protein VB070_12845 [Clostridiaceae bacterium]|nr:hypothetical protein [Clostridiaceae bacterium]